MNSTDKTIRWFTAAAVLGVTAVATVASYELAYGGAGMSQLARGAGGSPAEIGRAHV